MVKLTLRDKETAQEAVRRFRKLVERSGIKKEIRVREFYEKPSETKRRARLRADAAPAANASWAPSRVRFLPIFQELRVSLRVQSLTQRR